jgi:hypothetical protein
MGSDSQFLAFFANEHNRLTDYADGLTAPESYKSWLFFLAVKVSNPESE